MNPKRIILVRHGQSEGNENGNIYNEKPDYTLNLTEEGKKQASDAGKELAKILKKETAFFYVSPFWRTRETFEQIAQHLTKDQKEYLEDPRLREQEWGHLRTKEENDRIEEERDKYGPFYFRFPDGESCADVYDRVSDFFGTIQRDFSKKNFPENAIIVTHGMTIRLFLMKWFHWDVETFETYKNLDNCQLVIMEKKKGNKYTLISKLKTRPAKHGYQRPIKLK
jgi:broad specificity phosphatase PhoE